MRWFKLTKLIRGNHFTVYVSQIIILYTLNLHSAVCQLCLSKIRGREELYFTPSVRFLGWEDSLEEGMATHASILAWRITWTLEPGGLQSIGHKESDMTEATEHWAQSVQLLSCVWLFATSRTATCQASLPTTNSQSLLKLKTIKLVMPSNHLILCIPFSSCLQSFPASGSFLMSQFFASGGQNIGASASASVLPVDIQDWFPLGSTGLISLQYKGLSRVFFGTTFQKRQFFSAQRSLWSTSLFRIVSITRYTSLLRSDPIKGWKHPNLIRTNTRSALKQGFPTIAAWTPLLWGAIVCIADD